MTLNEFFIYVAIVEAVLIFFIFILILILKLKIDRDLESKRKKRERLSKYLLLYIHNEIAFKEIPKDILDFDVIVETLEKYDLLFSGSSWNEIKKEFIVGYVLPKARTLATSRDWVKRNLAARCFLLYSEPQDLKQIQKLLFDPVFHVRMLVPFILVRYESKEMVYLILKKMSEESSHFRYPYRDALIRSEESIYKWITQIYIEATDEEIKIVCLDVLGAKVNRNFIPVLFDDMESKNADIRLRITKLVSQIHLDESEEILIKSLQDPEWQIRAESAKGLGQIRAYDSIPYLENALNDSNNWVRMQAAQALIQLGEKGIQVLNSQSDKNPIALQIAEYMKAINYRI